MFTLDRYWHPSPLFSNSVAMISTQQQELFSFYMIMRIAIKIDLVSGSKSEFIE